MRPNRSTTCPDDVVDRRPLADVEGDAERRSARSLLGEPAGLLDVARRLRRDDNVGALLGETDAHGAADAGARSGDERDLALDPPAHERAPCGRSGRGARGGGAASQSLHAVPGRVPAVGEHDRPRDVRRLVGEQEPDDGGDLVRLGGAVERDPRAVLRPRRLVVTAAPRSRGVRTQPGATALTRMPCGARSTASERASCATAPFDALYVACSSSPRNEAVEAVQTIEPPPCAAMCRAAAIVIRYMPRTLTCIVWSKCSSGASSACSK